MRRTLTNERYEEIKQCIVGLLEEYRVKTIPIDPFALARAMGIKVIPYSKDDEGKRHLLLSLSEDGFFQETKEETLVIFFNEARNPGKIRYTIAHELGHIVLGHTQESQLSEKEANFFAKYLLAPPILIHKLGIETASEVSKHFDISYEAAQYAFNYYEKWLVSGPTQYTAYEKKMIELFGL